MHTIATTLITKHATEPTAMPMVTPVPAPIMASMAPVELFEMKHSVAVTEQNEVVLTFEIL
jgi:hypothetical protein